MKRNNILLPFIGPYITNIFSEYNQQDATFHYLFISVRRSTLDAGLLARSQYPEGPATGHLDTGFSWFSCA